MDDVPIVGMLERRGDVESKEQGAADGQFSALRKHGFQAFAVNKLKRDPRFSVFLTRIEYMDDIGMVKPRERFGFR